MPNRREIAERIVFGLGGWLQTLSAQNLHSMAGEDAARVMALQVLNAQNRYTPVTSQLPTNWQTTNTKFRVDIALRGISPEAENWNGVLEVRWPGRSFGVSNTRKAIVEDATRLTFVKTANLTANLLIVGGTREAIEKLFDKQHHRQALENERTAFCQLLQRNQIDKTGHLTNKDLQAYFPTFHSRIPDAVFNAFDGRIKAQLMAACTVMLGGSEVGKVYAWHCKRTRGTAHNN